MQEYKELFRVIWRRSSDNKVFTIGYLVINGEVPNVKYSFFYDAFGVKEAMKSGFRKLPEFPDVDIPYQDNKLFSTFTSRTPAPTRSDMWNKYDLNSNNHIELLKITKGLSMTDNIELEHRELTNKDVEIINQEPGFNV